jgi:hypothetical protein
MRLSFSKVPLRLYNRSVFAPPYTNNEVLFFSLPIQLSFYNLTPLCDDQRTWRNFKKNTHGATLSLKRNKHEST